MKKEEKGHGGLDVPWWFVPVFVLVYPFAAFGEWIRSKTRKSKGGDPDKDSSLDRSHFADKESLNRSVPLSGMDPHDISGEPNIPGGDRP